MTAGPARPDATATGPSRALAVTMLLVAVLTACAAPEVSPPGPDAVEMVRRPLGGEAGQAPTGMVSVVYPDEPAGYLDLRHDDPAAADLQALWGLPLFRIDPAGQLAGGLVRDWSVVDDAPWTVRLTLREGSWSDGAPVRAQDVVSTLEALRAGPRLDELAPLLTIDAIDTHQVELGFDRPYARWFALLDGVGVLPATVLAREGLDAYGEALPSTGGWFRLAEVEPGRRYLFLAHQGSPLGAPAIERLELLVVPRYDTALGLLADGSADVALGYLALNGVERARRSGSARADAPLGGTWVGLSWRHDGALGERAAAPRRRAILEAIDVSELVEGLLAGSGETASSPVPGVPSRPRSPVPEETEPGTPVIVLPRWQEALAFTARAIQRDLRVAGGGLELVDVAPPEFVAAARSRVDGALTVVRSGPRPSLVGLLDDRELALQADAAAPGEPAFTSGLSAVTQDARILPLYRVGVGHAWTGEVEGVRASSWPGLAFWDVGSWSVSRPS